MNARFPFKLPLTALAAIAQFSISPLAAASGCDNSRAQFQSDLFVTPKGSEKIVEMELGNQIPAIDKNIEKVTVPTLGLKTALGSLKMSNIHILSMDLGKPVVHCQGGQRMDCTVALTVKQVKLQGEGNIYGKDAQGQTALIAGPVKNLQLDAGSQQSIFTIHAIVKNDPLNPFEFVESGSGFSLGAKGLSLHAGKAKGDDPGGDALVNAIGEILSEDGSNAVLNRLISEQITQGILPPISDRINAVLSKLPLFSDDLSVKDSQIPGMSAATSSPADVQLRITAAEFDRVQQTMDFLLSACRSCFQNQTGLQFTVGWPGNASVLPQASTYDAAVGMTYVSLNNALSNIHGAGALSNICVDKNGKTETCPANGSALPVDETRFSTGAAPTVGFDASEGFYVNFSKVSVDGVSTVGAVSGSIKIYVTPKTSANGSSVVLTNPQVEENLSAKGNSFFVNQMFDGLMNVFSGVVTRLIVSKIQNKTLAVRSGINLNAIQADATGVRAFANFNLSSISANLTSPAQARPTP